jgi:hypothetical protein
VFGLPFDGFEFIGGLSQGFRAVLKVVFERSARGLG